MPKVSFHQQIGGWRTLANATAKKAAELPALAEQSAALAAAIEEATESYAKHRALTASAHGEARRREEAIARGEDAEKRLRRLLQAHYGADDPLLREFGLKPYRRASKSLVPAPPEDSEVSPEQPPGLPGDTEE